MKRTGQQKLGLNHRVNKNLCSKSTLLFWFTLQNCIDFEHYVCIIFHAIKPGWLGIHIHPFVKTSAKTICHLMKKNKFFPHFTVGHHPTNPHFQSAMPNTKTYPRQAGPKKNRFNSQRALLYRFLDHHRNQMTFKDGCLHFN